MTSKIIGIAALGIGVIALMLAVMLARAAASHDPGILPAFWRKLLRIKPREFLGATAFADGTTRHERIAFVVNPVKSGVPEFRELVFQTFAVRGLPQPLWLHTSPKDAGVAAAQAALFAKADLVVAVGGDGTVRAVASALLGTGVPMGIVPLGTGNLLARNLDLPLGDQQDLLNIIIDGSDQAIDVGHMSFTQRDENENATTVEDEIFLVIAGAGIDAEMVAGAEDQLKKRVGWLAYFFAALRHLRSKRMVATIQVDELDTFTGQMRTVLIANCGKLPGGFNLIPDASITDGKMDIAAIDARGGIVGWTDLLATVVGQSAGIKAPESLKGWRASRMDHMRGATVEISTTTPQKLQIDGEPMGYAVEIKARIAPGELQVRSIAAS